ncbi:MAG: TetR family transcriptional regulator [Deltaproteobacteria bacterium]|nr:TetR family transcriptional regulator [Deltaproteobacteria bacterium]
MNSMPQRRHVGRPPTPPPDGPKIKDIILEKSIEVLSEQGITNFSLKDISTRAGVTPAAIYYYFHNKKELVLQTLEFYLVPLVKSYWDIMKNEEDPVKMVTSLQERMFEIATEYPWFLALWTRELASDSHPMRKFLKERMSEYSFLSFSEKIKKGQDDKLIHPDIIPEMLFISIFSSLYINLLSRHNWEMIYNIEIPVPNLLKHIKALTVRGIIHNPEEEGRKAREAAAETVAKAAAETAPASDPAVETPVAPDVRADLAVPAEPVTPADPENPWNPDDPGARRDLETPNNPETRNPEEAHAQTDGNPAD